MSHQDTIQRSVLPILDRPRTGLVTYDTKDTETKFPAIKPLQPPKGAPNVLIVLIDDAGFGPPVPLVARAARRPAERIRRKQLSESPWRGSKDFSGPAIEDSLAGY